MYEHRKGDHTLSLKEITKELTKQSV